MALPDFLDRAATAASNVLEGYSRDLFEKILLSHHICLAFDQAAIASKEGRATLDLAVRLLARLYPHVQIRPLSSGSEKYQAELEKLARSINPAISLSEERDPTVYLVIGASALTVKAPIFYIGSENWLVKFSVNEAVSSGHTDNPLAAGAAACFGVANVFRAVFKEQLPRHQTDTAFTLSLLDYQVNIPDTSNPVLSDLDLGKIHLVGLGAVGNGFVWAFSRSPFLRGNLDLIDGEKVDLGNLQRYVLTSQKSKGLSKTRMAEEALKVLKLGKLRITGYPQHWGPYLTERKDWQLDKVAVAVDSAEDRIAIQASLPRIIYNAWTQTNDLGVSRHYDFTQNPCLACLYLPEKPKLNPYQEIAQSLGLQKAEEAQAIRDYLALNKPVDEVLLQKIAIAKSIPMSQLLPYMGKTVHDFYSQMVCGEMLLQLTTENAPPTTVEVPLAFQSALAGIMLAAEVIIDAAKLRTDPMPTRTRFNLLKPVTKHNSEDCDKLINSNCLCQDEDFRQMYRQKYEAAP